jgi:hypothetical protein
MLFMAHLDRQKQSDGGRHVTEQRHGGERQSTHLETATYGYARYFTVVGPMSQSDKKAGDITTATGLWTWNGAKSRHRDAATASVRSTVRIVKHRPYPVPAETWNRRDSIPIVDERLRITAACWEEGRRSTACVS